MGQFDFLATQIKILLKQKAEVIVVDGGSTDGTFDAIKKLDCQYILSPAGRAKQMNVGAQIAKGDVLVFLHADTGLPKKATETITSCLKNHQWGRFDVSLTGNSFLFRIIETLMNLRSCITSIATGDQCIFIKRALFDKCGGFTDIPLMEDIAMSKRLKKFSRTACIKDRVITSSRRWESKGIIRTIILMWYLRLAYFFGVSPHRLHKHYYK